MKSNARKNSPTKSITLDDLARMTQRGFDALHEEITHVRGDVGGVRKEVTGLRKEMSERFDLIEHKRVGAHDRRLDKIEDDMRVIKTSLEQKLSMTFPR